VGSVAYGTLHALAKEKMSPGTFDLIIGDKLYAAIVEEPKRVAFDEICESTDRGLASVGVLDQIVDHLPSGLNHFVDDLFDEGID
jgi:hypothetical protein